MEIEFSRDARKNARKIAQSDRRIAREMYQRIDGLRQNPVPPAAKQMAGTSGIVYRIPFAGDYGRIVYYVADGVVNIVAIDTREKGYRSQTASCASCSRPRGNDGGGV